MIYKFYVGSDLVIKCDKVKYEVIELKRQTFKYLVLYVKNLEVGTIALDEDIKIKYDKEKSHKTEKVYFVN